MKTYTLLLIKIVIGVIMIDPVVEGSSLTFSNVPREACCEVVKLSIFDDLALRCQGARTGLYLKQATDINGKAFYIHGQGESAIWYYSNFYSEYFWSIGNVDDKGTNYVGLFSTELLKTCPTEIYYKNWLYTCGSGFRAARSVVVQCSSMEEYCSEYNCWEWWKILLIVISCIFGIIIFLGFTRSFCARKKRTFENNVQLGLQNQANLTTGFNHHTSNNNRNSFSSTQ